MQQYGQIIAKLRKQHNLTQAELGKKLSVSYQAVSKWENNQSQPDLDTIQLLANVFGISVGEFLDDDYPRAQVTREQLPHYPHRIWYLITTLAVVILAMVLVVTLVPIKLSSDKIYERVDPAVFCLTLTKDNGDQMAGTGFFINDQGLAVTNYHVIENCTSGEVKLNNGKTYPVTKIVGCDEKRDLAIIQVAIKNNPQVTLGNSNKIKVGETVYAIGYPESFVLGNANSTLTQGIISKKSYTYAANSYIQTTVNITHGNSGGVLLNEQGKVIGITTLMLTDGTVDYMNMAIPINALKSVSRDLAFTLAEYKDQHIKFYYYSENKVYQTLDVMRGDTVKQPSQTPTKAGYRFVGWYCDRTYSEEYDFSVPLNEVGYCYAKWEPISYTVRFLANGSDGTMPDQTFIYDQPQVLAANLFTKHGHQFYIWIREFTDGRNPLYYYNQGTVRNLTTKDGDVIEFKAYFKPATYTINFAANGGTGTMAEQKVVYGEQTTLTPNTFTRDGYNFAGWEYAGQTYPDAAVVDQIVNQETTLTLTAVWQPITYTVVYLPDAANAEQEAVRVTVNYDESFSLLYAAYRVGYHVAYWLDRDTNKKYSTTTKQSNLATTDGQVVYLTPTWDINQYTVQFYYSAPPASGNRDKSIYCQWDQPFALEVPSGRVPKGYHLIGYTLEDGTMLVPNADGQYVNIVDTIKHGDCLNVYGAYQANSYSVYLWQEATDNFALLGTFAYDEQFILPTLPTKEYYTQVGWLIETKYGQWQRVEPIDQTAWLVWKLSANDGGKVYLRPKWVGDSYTVIFAGNGADSGEMPAETCEFGVTYYLTKNNFVKAGYFFAGWQDNHQVYADQSVFRPLTYTAVITLTAIWAPVYGKGSGVVDDPYQIATTDDFYQLATLITDYAVYCKAYYQLTNDLDFGGAAATFTKFQGVFDGQGHVIKNVTYAANNLKGGLFGLCLNATIKNLGVENYHLTLNNVYDSGGLVAIMYDTTLSNCYTVGTVSGDQTFACSFGGLVGEANSGTIENCYADVNVMMTNTSVYRTEVGGLVGKSSAVIKDAYAIVNLTLEFNKNSSSNEKLLAIAGLVGNHTGTSPITNCFAVVDLTVTIAANAVGGYEPLVSNFVNVTTGTEPGENCYVAVTAFNYTVDGQAQPAAPATATEITADNCQDEDWVTTNLFTDSTAWIYRDGEYPQLKVFEE